jgi:hypothetical protein
MKKNLFNYALILVSASAAFTFNSCKPTVVDPNIVADGVLINHDITGTRSLSKDTTYILQGNIFVTGTLNIEAGTIIKGDKLTKGTLIIKQGGKINAIGTASAPIVFTSRMAPGLRAAGDWGGVILVGKAPVNQSDPTVEGLAQPLHYGGGTDVHDNSGIMQYCRIEFGGIALQPDNEINGLTFCAVGDGTTIDHIQVSYAGDDSYEWFGGNVNCKYLVAYCGLDDEYDTDFGFSGHVQFALGVRHPRIADVSTSNGFESDNNATGTTETPISSCVFSNVTLIGPWKTSADKNVNSMFGAGMHIRRNSSLSAFNSVFAGWNTGLLLDATTTYNNATSGSLAIQNCALVACKVAAVKGANGVTDQQALDFFNTTSFGNQIIADNATAGIATSFIDATKTLPAGNPTSFLPASGSPLLTGAKYTHTKLQNAFFDKTPTFIGAFGTTDWTKGWTNFDPQNTVY